MTSLPASAEIARVVGLNASPEYIALYCSKCGAQLAPQAQFCVSCGAQTSPAVTSPTVPPGAGPPPGTVPSPGASPVGKYADLPLYWQSVFQRFDQRPGQMQTKWNWPSFFFGPFWYLFKGMPAKAAIYVVVIIATYGLGLFLAIYAGLYGAWDYYLKEAQGKQLW